MPVTEINKKLSEIWKTDIGEMEEESHASQMNVILHFGVKTTEEEALEYFEASIKFSQVYPARLIVLCPSEENKSEMKLDAKFFFQCYVGRSHRKRCCCEALMLGYDPDESQFLKNQVAVWLQSDLPTFHLFYKLPVKIIEKKYLNFARNAKKIVYDSSSDIHLNEVHWGSDHKAIDLAHARLLSIRQSIGQFLSGYSPEHIAEDINGISIDYSPDLLGEALVLSKWIHSCMEECSQDQTFITKNHPKQDLSFISINFDYNKDSNKHFKWHFDKKKGFARIDANIGKGPIQYQHKTSLLDLNKALSEALFF